MRERGLLSASTVATDAHTMVCAISTKAGAICFRGVIVE
jgi:hypothetical protein